MNVVNTLLHYVAVRSGAESQQLFYDRFLNSQFADQLAKPLLTQKPTTVKHLECLTEINYSTLTHLKITNTQRVDITLSFKENFLAKLTTLEKAFETFINLSSHSNPLGDFRKYSDIYHPMYCTSRYIFFHGDGNCVTLGVLLYALLENFFQKNAIDLYYSCGLQREFMHVYALTSSKTKPQYYVDPDQKIYCLYNKLDDIYSPGLIYQLLSAAGFYVYDNIPKENRQHLFFSMTHELMDEYRVLPGPIIYRKAPHVANFSELFMTARKLNSERLEVKSTDYPWKSYYQKIGKQFYNMELPFLSKLHEIATFKLPPQGIFEIGLHTLHPKEIKDLCLIFFGRVPLSITWSMESNKSYIVPFPEIPWMIYFDRHVQNCYFQNNFFELHSSECEKYRYLGMGDIEKIVKFNETMQFSIMVQQPCQIRVVFPLNALALNADLIRLNTSNENIEIKLCDY